MPNRIDKKMEISGLSKVRVSAASTASASSFRNMAVWEGGYNICLEICKFADRLEEKDNVLIQNLRSTAAQIPLDLAKGASFKIGRQYIKHLKTAFISSKQLATVLMLCHDLNYIPTENFLELNSKVDIFSSKLWKYIKFNERKVKQKSNRR